MKRALVCLVVFLFVSTAPSYAWNSFGHMEVAYLAYQKLTPATQARVWALLQLNPDFHTWEATIPAGTSDADKQMMIFMIASIWADQIKGVPPYKDRFTDEDPKNANTPNGPTAGQNIGYSDLFRHRYWHFIDRPFSQDGTPLPPVPAPNAETQIAAFRAVLSSTSPDDLKSYDMVWLLHLVGDIHQPLHAVARIEKDQPNGDAGGNFVKCVVDGQSKPGNLHGFWDDVLGSMGNDVDYQSVIAAAKQLPKPSAGKAKIKDADVWITESFNLAKSKVYKSPIGAGPGPFTLTAKYKATAQAAAKQRAALAGARLANLLNQELK
jgi:S1/P1 Nuclease